MRIQWVRKGGVIYLATSQGDAIAVELGQAGQVRWRLGQAWWLRGRPRLRLGQIM